AYLDESKLVNLALSELELLGSQSRSMLEKTLFALMRKFPKNIEVYSNAMQCFVKYQDKRNSIRVAKRIIDNFKDGSVCRAARRMISDCHILEKNWIPSSFNARELKHNRNSRANKAPRVAVLLGTSPESTQESCFLHIVNSIRKHRLATLFAITPLGYKDGAICGTHVEMQEKNGDVFFHLDSVSPEDVEQIPVESQIEYSILSISEIFGRQKPHAIHAYIGHSGLPQAIIGVTLAKIHQLPLVIEITDSDFTFNDINSTNLRNRPAFKSDYVGKLLQCLEAADIVIAA